MATNKRPHKEALVGKHDNCLEFLETAEVFKKPAVSKRGPLNVKPVMQGCSAACLSHLHGVRVSRFQILHPDTEKKGEPKGSPFFFPYGSEWRDKSLPFRRSDGEVKMCS